MSASIITQEKLCASKRHTNNSIAVEWHDQRQHPTTIKNSSHNRTRHIKAKDSCSKGQAPDINDINKGLDSDAKTRLKNLYNQNSRMFDGTAKLPDKDFEPAPSKQTAALTGKGGGVADLKAYEPAVPKLGRATEFSLSGTKLSGDTSNPATIKPTFRL